MVAGLIHFGYRWRLPKETNFLYYLLPYTSIFLILLNIMALGYDNSSGRAVLWVNILHGSESTCICDINERLQKIIVKFHYLFCHRPYQCFCDGPRTRLFFIHREIFELQGAIMSSIYTSAILWNNSNFNQSLALYTHVMDIGTSTLFLWDF